ncbi:UTP--glucose-1-phosphate uridylyltransferase GalU [Cytobacillus firmus]|uniref:UTP--glucose-1-phosphate uridylyltransferase GalU n=1 Tax=Cytobacillus firmus TaxID=1399 RepID=UPI003B9F8FC0
MKKVRKAIIPAAGLGTRFLPATKAMPKEMLPIVDKPTIQYIVEEAVASGIEDHFDHSFELEENLIQKKKFDLLEKVKEPLKVDIHYIRQKEPKGLGHAVWCAGKFIGDEPFAVLLGDDIVQAEKPCLRQLMDEYEGTQASIIGAQSVSPEETHRYGEIDPSDQIGRRYQVNHFVEKPKQGTTPSNLAIMGRYILNPENFMFLEQQELGAGGEIQLTDAIQKLNQIQRVFAYDFEGVRYDVGEKFGFIKTTIEMALQDEGLRDELVEFLEERLAGFRMMKG